MKLVAATRNPHKLEEIRAILGDIGWEVLSLADFPEVTEVEEDGETFEANALKKARAIAQATGYPCLADDSGLEVDALNGAPGVHSKRFGGPSDADRNRKLLRLLEGVPQERRTARFVCAAALAWPDGRAEVLRGTCEGRITFHPRGESGFGYDPVFLIPEYHKTFAELGPAIKNQISHRARAFQKVRERLIQERETHASS